MTEQPLTALRQDWIDFLDPGGLRRWAGWNALDEVLVKELADNAADTAETEVNVFLEDETLVVENDGPGLAIAPEELFSIRRPLTSSKVWRCAGRGALGNGARVVAGIVASHGGTLTVTSAGQRTSLGFDDHGTTLVLDRADVGPTSGTRIEIARMPRLPIAPDVVSEYRRLSAPGQSYTGRPDPHWFDADGMLSLFRGLPGETVRRLAGQFHVAKGTLAGDDRLLGTLQRDDAVDLLTTLRAAARKPSALASLGEDCFANDYAVAKGDVTIGEAQIPAIVEVWSMAQSASSREAEVHVTGLIMNRTIALAHLDGHWASRRVTLRLGPTSIRIDGLSAATWHVVVAVTCPYVPVLSAGKAPDLSAFAPLIVKAAKASLRASRAGTQRGSTGGFSIKEAASLVMETAYLEASAAGTLPANARQIMYAARGPILEMTGKDSFNDKYFTQNLLPDYLAENPDTTKSWDVVYDARGTFSEPHSHRQVALGTLSVRSYLNRQHGAVRGAGPWLYDAAPADRFRRILFIEKEGFSALLEQARIAARFDCAIASTKGMSVTAMRQLIDRLADDVPDLEVYTMTDFDVTGVGIQRWLTESGRRYAFENDIRSRIIALDFEQAQELHRLGRSEPGGFSEDANGVFTRLTGTYGLTTEAASWLAFKKMRVELNALPSDQIISLIEMTLGGQEKLIPPGATLERAYRQATAEAAARKARSAALEQADGSADTGALRDHISRLLDADPTLSWDEALMTVCIAKT